MNVHDEMSDTEVLRAASGSLAAIPMASPPDVEAIMARGRARRRRRLSGIAGLSVTAAAGAALALSLTGVLGPAPARGTGTIQTAAFTIASNSDGTATLTIKPGELLDPAALQSDLAQYGIPAMVTTGSLCTSDPAPAGFSQVVSSSPAGPSTVTPQPVANPTITIDPSALPAGTELSVGDFQLSSGDYSGQQQADFVLIDTNSYTCSSTPPDPNALPDGYGPADGIGLLYGGPGPAGQ
jgi:hypothetical protein